MVLPIIMAGARIAGAGLRGISKLGSSAVKGIKTHMQKIPGGAKTVAAGGAGLMGGLALKGVRGAADKTSQLDIASKKTLGSVFAFFAIILWIVDLTPWFGGVYSGFNFDPQNFWNNWFSSFTFGNVWFDLGLILIVIFIVVKYVGGQRPTGADIFSISLFILAMIFFMANPGWMAYPKAILHFLFIILFGLFYVKQTSSSNTAFLAIAGLLFFDFFFFSTVFKLIPLFKYISLLGAIIIIVTFAQSPSGFTAFLFISLIILIMILTVAEGFPASGVFFEESEEGRAPLSELGDRITKGFGNWRQQVTSTLEAQVQYAITGKVEENQYEPLGVYLENVQSADPKYYADEEVIVWGTVKARTLDDKIDIKVGCYVKDRDDPEMVAKEIDPPSEFEVFTMEEQDFVCRFTDQIGDEGKALKVGTNTITTFADFNFETLAYLKTYFIDNERKRAMTREGLDVFEEFDIKDKNPVTVYTNGPVEIGMETTNPLIGVGKDTYPYLSVSLQNRPGWEGKITELKGLTLFFPPGVLFGDCSREFKLGGCEDSCETDKCIETCESLSEGGYQAYSLDLEDPKIKDYLGDFEKFKLFRCRFTPSDSVLGNTPITTEYFRAKAKYDYTVEKPITVKIVEVPGGIEEKGSVASATEPATTPTTTLPCSSDNCNLCSSSCNECTTNGCGWCVGLDDCWDINEEENCLGGGGSGWYINKAQC